jgi:cytoskeletal protein CcmA (bactofilin family)
MVLERRKVLVDMRNHLRLFGSGSSSGGIYDKVKIFGEGKILKDIDCTVFRTFGQADVRENLNSNILSVFGELSIKENLKVKKAKVLGTLKNDGDFLADELYVLGVVEVNGNFHGNHAKIKGKLLVDGDCEVETLRLTGHFQIDGLLNGEKIDINLKYVDSHVTEIGGQEINIVKKASIFGNKIPSIKLHVQAIEGDHIYLEYTKAKVVRGSNVEIGPGCEIGRVEYEMDFKQHKQSVVKEKMKR